jgi:hypothetical protein
MAGLPQYTQFTRASTVVALFSQRFPDDHLFRRSCVAQQSNRNGSIWDRSMR